MIHHSIRIRLAVCRACRKRCGSRVRKKRRRAIRRRRSSARVSGTDVQRWSADRGPPRVANSLLQKSPGSARGWALKPHQPWFT